MYRNIPLKNIYVIAIYPLLLNVFKSYNYLLQFVNDKLNPIHTKYPVQKNTQSPFAQTGNKVGVWVGVGVGCTKSSVSM